MPQPQQATTPPIGHDHPPARRDMPAPTVSGDTRKTDRAQCPEHPELTRSGEIKSVYVGPDGRSTALFVGVGGILGVGEREVRLAWV